MNVGTKKNFDMHYAWEVSAQVVHFPIIVTTQTQIQPKVNSASGLTQKLFAHHQYHPILPLTTKLSSSLALDK